MKSNEKIFKNIKKVIFILVFVIFFTIIHEKAYADELPSSYDLRDYIDIKVEDQGTRGTCWTFAALNTVETYLSLHGYGDYDFSEMHVECLQNGFDSAVNLGEDTYEYNDGDGGYYSYFIDYIAAGRGPVLETEIPYYKNNIEGERYTEEDRELFENATQAAYVYDYVEYSKYDYDSTEDFRNIIKKHIMENGALSAHINAYCIDEEYYCYCTDYEERFKS